MGNNIYGDKAEGDKVVGDKVLGNKIVQNFAAPAEMTVSLEEALARLEEMPVDRVPKVKPGSLPENSRIVHSANVNFTGRVEDLMGLARLFKGVAHDKQAREDGQPQAAVITSTAVTGLGGVGKTQLAAEFAHRYGRYFQGGVFWLSFADPKAVPAEIVACAPAMGLAGLDGTELAQQVALVRRAWEQEGVPRLLIFDNCETETLFDEYRPKMGGARVLLTSRRGRWPPGLGVAERPLGLLSRTESVALLRRFWKPLTEAEAEAIAAALGDLPLALHLAGSYLSFHAGDVSAADFLAELEQEGPFHEALAGAYEDHSPTRHERNLARTFELSYENLAQQDLAHRILVNLVHLAPGEPVPDELLKATLGEEGGRPADKEISTARRRLEKLGLVTVEEGRAVRLHRLVGDYVGRVVDEAVLKAALMEVEIGVGNEAIRLNKAGYPAPLLACQNHLRYVVDRSLEREDEQSAWLASEMGYHLQMVADYPGVRPYFERALAIFERLLGPEHPDTARSLNNLGYLLYDTGDLAGVRPYFERALAIWERLLGPEHPDTAISLNNLGRLLQATGDLIGARPYYERALAIWEGLLGPEHPNTATSLNNLGMLLEALGDLEGARSYLERALAIRERVLGPEHPDTARSLNNLGVLLQATGDLAGARTYYERALAIWERILGLEHPNTAISLNNLGYLLQAMGDLAGARPYFERALAIRERLLGPEHPDTALSLNNLGMLLEALGDLDGAKSYLERALAIFEAKLGAEHPNTKIVWRNLESLG